jgi:hypothetical protein
MNRRSLFDRCISAHIANATPRQDSLREARGIIYSAIIGVILWAAIIGIGFLLGGVKL